MLFQLLNLTKLGKIVDYIIRSLRGHFRTVEISRFNRLIAIRDDKLVASE
jgi:hypothetical protein